MKPFRTSLTARIISIAAAFALLSGGLIPTLGLNVAWAVPVVLLLTIGAGIVGLVMGVNDHPGKVALTAMLLPMALWPYTMVIIYAATARPSWALALSAAGLVMLGLTVAATMTVTAEAEEPAQRMTSTERSA